MGVWLSQGGSLGRWDFALDVDGVSRSPTGAGTELEETFRNRIPRNMSGNPEMRTLRLLIKTMVWPVKLNPYQIQFWLGKC